MRRAANLVMTQLEGDAEPVATLVGQRDSIRHHDIGLWDTPGLPAVDSLDGADKATPTLGESLLEGVDVVLKCHVGRPREVESGGNLLSPSPTRSLIPVPPFTTPAGIICPTTVLATTRWTRRSGRCCACTMLLIRADSEFRFAGGSRLGLMRRRRLPRGLVARLPKQASARRLPGRFEQSLAA